jgi:hypothetical protein
MRRHSLTHPTHPRQESGDTAEIQAFIAREKRAASKAAAFGTQDGSAGKHSGKGANQDQEDQDEDAHRRLALELAAAREKESHQQLGSYYESAVLGGGERDPRLREKELAAQRAANASAHMQAIVADGEVRGREEERRGVKGEGAGEWASEWRQRSECCWLPLSEPSVRV